MLQGLEKDICMWKSVWIYSRYVDCTYSSWWFFFLNFRGCKPMSCRKWNFSFLCFLSKQIYSSDEERPRWLLIGTKKSSFLRICLRVELCGVSWERNKKLFHNLS